jgi:hypothetical protein
MQVEATAILPRPSRKTRQKTRLIAVRNLDQRTRAAVQARKLAAEFEAELGGNVTTAMRIAIDRAATLTIVAEDARARRLAGDLDITLDDLVRTDRAAAAAVRALGLDHGRKPSNPPALDLQSSLAAQAETVQDGAAASPSAQTHVPGTPQPTRMNAPTGFLGLLAPHSVKRAARHDAGH